MKLIFDETSEEVANNINASFEKRNAERFFEQCADEILQASAQYVKAEYKEIGSERIEVLLEEICKAFSRVKVGKAFSENNYSEKYLNSSIMGALELIDKKSELEVNFCNNLVGKISFYLCQYIHLAPNFVPVSIRQILDNQHEIINVLQTVVKLTEPIRSEEKGGGGVAYLSEIKRSLKFIQVFGLSTHSIKKKYLLKSSYISLTVTEGSSEGFDSGLRVDDFLSSGKRFLVVGAAGSGKTTLLQWAALQCCEVGEKSSIERFSGFVPIFVRLRSIESFGGSMSIVDAARKSNSNAFIDFNENWLREKKEKGEVLFLIDGLDEVPTEQRSQAVKWIEETSIWADQCPVILTTRPISEQHNFLGEFRTAHLENMSHEDISNFISYWHRAVAQGLVDEAIVHSLDASKERLITAISAIKSLRALATNPLMCAVLCTINLDRNCNIPREKGHIYQAAIELLLERRDLERSIEDDSFSKIGSADKRFVLQEAARWLTLNERPEISKKKFREIIKTKFHHLSEKQVDELLIYFIERSGLLRDVSAENLDFIHKQFQELLAAESFVQEDDIGFLEKHIGSDAWAEIFPLACSLMNKTQASELLKKMIIHAETGSLKSRRKLLFQTILCAQFVTRLDPLVKEDIEARQPELFPPRNVDEVYQLIPLGEKLIPLVSEIQGKDNTDATTALCVKALVETGSSSELPIIANFAASGGRNTLEQAISGWSYFDVDEYGRLVIQNITSPYDVIWEGKTKVGGLVFANQAREISLIDCFGGESLRYLPETEICKTITISNDQYLCDISEIHRLPNVRDVMLHACDGVTDLSPLAGCSKIRNLQVVHCRRVENIDFVRNLPELEELSFFGCYDIENISAISNLKNLRELDLGGCYAITDWRCLEELPRLEHVSCAEESALYGLSADFFERVDIN